MKTVVITDAKYRSSIAAVRTLGQAGYRVILVQTSKESAAPPPSFFSQFCAEQHWIEGSCRDESYAVLLRQLLERYERPALLCIGADSLYTVSRHREEFAQVCDFLIAPPEVLDALNDKQQVHRRAEELGLPVPRQYEKTPETYPVVIKPRCGEKSGLKARDRYTIAADAAAYARAMEAVRRYDANPVVQERLIGAGEGVSLLLGQNGELLDAICHRRVREYPYSGGPSTCCESFFDDGMVKQAYTLLHSFGFTGLAMVEFKARRILEVNPRIWGSFPLTACCGSKIAVHYVQAAAGEPVAYCPGDYRTGVRMRFALNDAAAMLDALRHGKPGVFFGGVADCFRAQEALRSQEDPSPFRRYLKTALRR